MEIKKNLSSLFTGLMLSLSKGDKEILKSMLEKDSEAPTATHQTQYAPSKFLQGMLKGEINEEYRIWFYRVLARADEITMATIDGATGKSQKQLLQEQMEIRGGKGIENIIPCRPIVCEDGNYYPVRTNGDIENISEQLYVKTSNNKQKSFEFHINIYNNKHIYENLKSRGPYLGKLHEINQIEYDIVKFDEELSTYIDVPNNYLVKYIDFYKSENPGFFIIKFIST